MAQPHPAGGPGYSPPAESPRPASQDGCNDGQADVDRRKMETEDVVQMLVKLKESVKELRRDVARTREQAEWGWKVAAFTGIFIPVGVYLGICLFLSDLWQEDSFAASIVKGK